MKYGSICSGIEAATVAWHPMGWKPVFFSEIEPFPRAVLAHHYSDVPCHGDFTTIKDDDYDPIDLLVGGTPCQSFSIAGLRKGLADERGNLTLEFVRLAQRLKPRWLVWENVPGVLSNDKGKAFASFLGGLAECGYGFAYRVLDAQYFGVPQQRKRVFVIGYFGDWRPPAAVLFESESLRGDITPRREAGEGVAGTPQGIAGTCSAKWMKGTGGPSGNECQNLVAMKLSHTKTNGSGVNYDGQGYTLEASGSCNQAIAFSHKDDGRDVTVETSPALCAQHNQMSVFNRMGARKLTPLECERLQGLPDHYTAIPGASDSKRYKAIGNSMAVPVMRWIGDRIQMVEGMTTCN